MTRFLLLLSLTAGAPAPAASANLVPNGSFDEGAKGWRLSDGRPQFVKMGAGRVVTDHVKHGKRAYLYEKTVAEKWYPQLWTGVLPAKPGGYYEASAMVDARQDFVFRHTFVFQGRVVKLNTPMDATQGWKRVKLRFRVLARSKGVMLGFQMNGVAGKMWIDDVRLVETEPFEEETVGVVPLGPPADRIHGLEELAKRTRIKPFTMLKRGDGSYGSERIVFKDTATGATLWKMSHNPGYNRHVYSNMPVWNANGSKLMLRSDRDTRYGYWLVEADGRRWPFTGKAFWQWSRTNPNVFYWGRRADGEIDEANIATGKDRLLWKLPIKRFAFMPPSLDGKKLLVIENSQSRTAERSYVWLLNADGSGEPQKFDLGTVAHQTWFLKRDDYSFMFNDEKRNTKNKYQDNQWICEPAKGGAIHVFDKRHLTHAGVSPSGKRVAHHRGGICLSDVETGKLTHCMAGRGGHISWECDDRWLVATMGNNIYEIWVDERRARRVCVPNTQLGYSTYATEAHLESSPDGTKVGYASSMMGDCDFYVAVQRLPDPPRNVKLDGKMLTWDPPERSLETAGYFIYRDGIPLTREPIQARRFVVPDPAGHYTVTAVEHSGLESPRKDTASPAAPTHAAGEAQSPYAAALAWRAPSDADLAYFNVYASSAGAPAPVQARRVGSPTEPHFIDWGLQTGTTYQYVVTAVDRAGNESRPTPVVRVRTPAIQAFRQKVASGQVLGKDPVAVKFSVPRDGDYLLWAELKPEKIARRPAIRFELAGVKGNWRPLWDFVCVGHGDPRPVAFFDTVKRTTKANRAEPRFALGAGEHELKLALSKGAAEVVSLTVTNDLGYVPKGITSFLAKRAR